MTPIAQISAQASPWSRAVEILICTPRTPGSPPKVASLTWKVQDEFQTAEPTARLNYDDAQILMDDLWRAGLRPSEGTGSAGAFAAQARHLEDMRTLVFKHTA